MSDVREQQDEGTGREEEISSSSATRRERSRPPRKSRRCLRPGDIFLAILVITVLVLVVAFRPGDLFNLLYNQTMGLILIVIVVQYLILKSMDRTRIYELENRRIREYRRSERALLKRCRDVMLEGAEMDCSVDEETRKRWKAKAELLSEDIRDVL